MEALLIFFAFFFYFSITFIFALSFYFLFLFFESAAKSEYNSCQSTNTLSAFDTDSLLNIVQLILLSKPL
jgi:hypothetical protein